MAKVLSSFEKLVETQSNFAVLSTDVLKKSLFFSFDTVNGITNITFDRQCCLDVAG